MNLKDKCKHLTVKQSKFQDCDFRSKGEKDTAFELLARKQNKEIKRWQFEKHIDLVVNGITVCEIWPDFLIEYPNGRLQVIEVKGGQLMKSRYWSVKKKLFQVLFPHVEYTVKDTFFKSKKKKLKTWNGKKWVTWKPSVIQM